MLKVSIKGDQRLDALSIVVLMSAIWMNAVLAIINAHLLQMSNFIVTAVQLVITAAALAVTSSRYWRVGWWFPAATAAIIMFNVLAATNHAAINLKGLYDALILPIFIALGATVSSFPRRSVIRLFAAVAIVAVLETFFTSVYVTVLEPLSYLSATRDWVADAAAGKKLDTGLYVGAARAGGQAFSFISDHRVGSIFLEPVSLGYFSLVFSIAAQYLFRQERGRYWISVVVCIVLSLLADSRIPTALILICTVIGLLNLRWAGAARVLVPFVVLGLAATLHYSDLADRFGELGYRIAYTFDALDGSQLSAVLLGSVEVGKVGDSGVGLLIYNNGLFGALVAFAAACGLLNSQWRRFSSVPVCASLYATTALLFGGALFSIKTAALLGFMLGAVGRAGRNQVGAKAETDEELMSSFGSENRNALRA